MPSSLAIEETYQRRVRFETGEAIEDVLADLASAARQAGEKLVKLGVMDQWPTWQGAVRRNDAEAIRWFEACVIEAARDQLNRDGEEALTVLGEGL